MEKLVSGNNYECARATNGRIDLLYVENDVKRVLSFYDTMHNNFLSKASYFIVNEHTILEVVSIDFVNFETGFTHFTGKVKIWESIINI